MTFDIDDILEGGLDIDLTIGCDRFYIQQEDCHLSKEVKVQGNLTRLNLEVFLNGKVKTELRLNCSRCLEPLDFSIHAKLFARFIALGTIDNPSLEYEIDKNEVEIEYYSENRIDISRPVRDAILLDLPMVGLCQEDCLGLCDICGKNLNQGSCQCTKNQDVDPRLEILNQLKDKLK